MFESNHAFETARRHIHVALVDLQYAEAEMTQCLSKRSTAEEEEATLGLLQAQVDALRELAGLVGTIAEKCDPARERREILQRHWPDLVRS